MPDYDVIVVGAGNAALAASVSALEHGAATVLVLEKAPREMRGGNTYWSGGLLRIVFNAARDLERLTPQRGSNCRGSSITSSRTRPTIFGRISGV